MSHARPVYLCDGVRTPFGRFRGGLSMVRTDDLAALPIRHLLDRHPGIEAAIDEVILGCANQAREQRGHARDVAIVLAGLVRAAEDHLVDRRIDARVAIEQVANRQRGEIVRAHHGEAAAKTAERRAHAVAEIDGARIVHAFALTR